MIINDYAKEKIGMCLKNYNAICEAIDSSKLNITVVKDKKEISLNTQDLVDWINCIQDFLSSEKNIYAKRIFWMSYIERKTEAYIQNNIFISRGTCQRIKKDIFMRIYTLCLAKGLITYECVLMDKINR